MNPTWGEDWPAVRALWALDPGVTFLNHGSFGACPRPVLDRQATLRAEMERQPVEFLSRRLPQLVGEVRGRVAAFLRADPEGLVFVPNATTGVATVLASMRLEPGDRVLVTDHAYPAVLNAVRRASDRWGVEIAVCHVPVPLPDPDGIVDTVMAGLTARTRLAIVDHVTSATGALFPVAELVVACRERGVPVLVDAAHAPGMIPVDVEALGADFWTGNFHKWVCAPKGAGALAVAPGQRDRMLPLVTSHGYRGSLHDEFDWSGTHDPTALLSVPAAIDFMEGLGWDRVRGHNHQLVAYGQQVVSGAVGVPAPVPPSRFGSMAIVELPPGTASTEEGTLALQELLYRRARIEVPFVWWDRRCFVRLSAQAYNRPADYDRLAEHLPQILP